MSCVEDDSMTPDDLIPVGRTSLVKRGSTSLQVQTEYAPRPYPRITTTVLNSGQVVHKIGIKLEHAVNSMEEQGRIEAAMQQQHSEVVALIQKEAAVNKPGSAGRETHDGTQCSVYDKLASLPGFQHIYRLGVDGAFASNNASRQFKRAFAAVFKNLQQVIAIFPLMPGEKGVRQKGVCEVEPDRLYFISTGRECYFVAVQPIGGQTDYEKALKGVLVDSD